MSDTSDGLSAGMGSRRKLFLLILVIVVCILGIGGYTTYAYLYHKWPFAPDITVTPAAQVAGNAAVAAQPSGAAIDNTEQYVRFERAFTFNLPSAKSNKGHMVQAEIVLVTVGQMNTALAQKHLPLISATISEICGQQDFDSLASPSGRQRFKRLLLDGIRTKMTGITNEPVVEQVLFTNFVMQ
ncbi:MAG: flagellar basal body-associated FliL family protein [Candidatus Anaerobiospirillum pullicola]|uniref:Flagellar protein FliL n=1 Tax=Candidatus Anaerobiospirillum pullicola TaxID=2838451 RepID=A0A948WYG8_9GAMM|nr:flagellar basal body-associated FliL family protein [Candidatus Anaerobiospirillum pullicola]